jgi:serine/threonine protein phosphatase 1
LRPSQKLKNQTRSENANYPSQRICQHAQEVNFGPGLLDVIFGRKPLSPPRAARVPEGVRLYAIGDIHGRADLLAQVFARIDASCVDIVADKAIHVFLGDYVDRGPRSREVLDLLIRRRLQYPLVCLKGNHEQYLLEFLNNPAVLDEWRRFGGLDTLLSYGLAPSLKPDGQESIVLSSNLNRALPESHRLFLNSLALSFTCGGFFFVHAGVRPGIALARQAQEDLLSIRDDFLLYEEAYEKVVVHGHTPVVKPDVRANRINIDTGAYATGRLTCLMLERDRMSFILPPT